DVFQVNQVQVEGSEAAFLQSVERIFKDLHGRNRRLPLGECVLPLFDNSGIAQKLLTHALSQHPLAFGQAEGQLLLVFTFEEQHGTSHQKAQQAQIAKVNQDQLSREGFEHT